MREQLTRVNTPLLVLLAVIALGVIGDGVILVNHFRASGHVTTALEADDQAGPKTNDKKQHPCNHGFYVSQAAHAHKGGAYVKQIAQSNLGKDGNCAAPLPAPGTPPKPSSDEPDESDD